MSDKEKTYDYTTNIMDNERQGFITEEVDQGSLKKTRLIVTLCILLTEMCERFTYFCIVANLVLFANVKLGYTEVEATTINQVSSGFAYIIPIFGGFIADSYAGRFKTILISVLIYLVGLVLIPASAVDYENWGWNSVDEGGRRALFLSGLVFVAFGSGLMKSNLGPFGAEQVQCLGKDAVQTFFNWFYWVINVGALVAYGGVSYIQQEVSFAWGFFVPLVSMVLALISFVIVKEKYVRTQPKGSVFVQVFGVCRQGCCKPIPSPNPEMEKGSEKKVLAPAKQAYGGHYENHFVDGVYSVLRMIPFCFLVIIYYAIFAQMTNTFFVQGTRMDVRMGGGANVPVAALNVFDTIIVIILIPVIDRGLYPFFQRLGRPLTYLKKMGIGMVIAASGMFVAGAIEIYRKEEDFHEQKLADKYYNASAMSVFAQVPQFILIGISGIFTVVTSLEFAYNQAPVAMQGVLTGLFLAAAGVGSWVSSAILLIVEKATASDPWWGNEINETHMEYLLFLLGGLMMLNFFIFCVVAHFYSYQDPSAFEQNDEENAGTSKDKSRDFNKSLIEEQSFSQGIVNLDNGEND